MRYFPGVYSNLRYGGTLGGRMKAKVVDIDFVSHRTRGKSVAADMYSRHSSCRSISRVLGRSSMFMSSEAGRRRMAVRTRTLFWAEEI